jgi:ppGpp synthetase/RelA/SpoT-type nucleotidyltranferase
LLILLAMTSPYTIDSSKIVVEPDLLSQIEKGDDERKQFEEHYEQRKRVLEAHVYTAIQLFEDEANGLKARFIEHVPISWRIKEIRSAIGSLRRRQNDRQRRALLKERFESLKTGGSWERYWTRQAKRYLINDVGAFPSYDSMFDALHDLGGLRVCVYFPEDIKRVIEFIKEHPDFEEDPIIAEWGPGTSPDDDLEVYLDNIEGADNQEQDADVSMPPQPEPRPFGGYRATHVRLKVKASAVDWNKTSFLPSQRPKGDYTIEVQISTAVMHAWAQVEQDLIYKPKQGPASQGLRNILDIFNGIVAMGETSLKQLALIQAEERERSAEAKNALAEDRDILSSWIWKACREVSPAIQDPRTRASPATRTWSHLGKLLLILQSSQNHSYGAISRLVRLAIEHKEGQPVACDFALDILAALARERKRRDSSDSLDSATREGETTSTRNRGYSDPYGENLREELRAEVLYIVEVVKMAMFLGVEGDFVPCARKAIRQQDDDKQEGRTPSLLDMLDFLHPDKPKLCNEHFYDMKRFCGKFHKMDLRAAAESKEQHFKALLPRELVDSGYRAQPKLQHNVPFVPGIRPRAVVPRELCAFLDDPEDTHWVPEILVLAKMMAEGYNRRLDMIRASRYPARTYPARGQVFDPHAIPGRAPTNQDVIYNLLKDYQRFNFASEMDGGDRTKLTIDRQMVPLQWSMTGGVPSLHVDKNVQSPRPHPGYFSAITTPTENTSDEDGTLQYGWVYSQGHARSWTVRWEENPSADMTAVGMRDPSHSEFLGFARRLNAAYGSVDQLDDEYLITNQGNQFTLESTPDEYVLRQRVDYHDGSVTVTS